MAITKTVKIVEKKANELKYLYPNEEITILNGIIGILSKNGILKDTLYIGNDYFYEDGYLYSISTNKKKKCLI